MKTDKDLYRQLRALGCEKLWRDEVPRFDQLSPKDRMANVALIRAVGVVFSESGTPAQKAEVRAWLVRLLKDPAEKIRRYAMAALPKLGSGTAEEKELLSVLQSSQGDRETKSVGKALDKIGGAATLDVVSESPGLLQTEQKVRAAVARQSSPTIVRMDSVLSDFKRLRIHLRCRRGLEDIVNDELEDAIAKGLRVRVLEVGRRFVAVSPLAPFTLADLYKLRCFAHVGLVLGTVPGKDPAKCVDAMASVIASPLSRRLFETFTEGPMRYRLDFVTEGHQRGTIHQIANRVYALCPEILNDARSAPWSIDIHPAPQGLSLELRPRLSPDPRLYYRTDDVPAASHPPLAACMARLAGRVKDEIIWDPFCGSGLELIESGLLGDVKKVIGTDLSPEAIAIAKANFAAAKLEGVQGEFLAADFRDFEKIKALGPNSVTLVITNPPMGRRIRIKDMQGLFREFFDAATKALKPGGRLILANPLKQEPRSPSMKNEYREIIDLSGFNCRLEVYVKQTS